MIQFYLLKAPNLFQSLQTFLWICKKGLLYHKSMCEPLSYENRTKPNSPFLLKYTLHFSILHFFPVTARKKYVILKTKLQGHKSNSEKTDHIFLMKSWWNNYPDTLTFHRSGYPEESQLVSHSHIEPPWRAEALRYKEESMDFKVRSEFKSWLQPLTSLTSLRLNFLVLMSWGLNEITYPQ